MASAAAQTSFCFNIVGCRRGVFGFFVGRFFKVTEVAGFARKLQPCIFFRVIGSNSTLACH